MGPQKEKKIGERHGDLFWNFSCSFDNPCVNIDLTSSLVACSVVVMYRVIQWRHQVLRRKGYLKFYRQMKNVRRVPFIIVSVCNAALLMYVSLLYFFGVSQASSLRGMRPVVALYFLVGLEMLFTLPCLVYYIGEGCVCVCVHVCMCACVCVCVCVCGNFVLVTDRC